jgi:predicted component of type VI protein secretion system
MHPGEVNRLAHVPVHVHDGEATPQAQVWLTERFAERMLDEGVMPLASVKNSDAVQVVRFQSVTKPATLLAGPWK